MVVLTGGVEFGTPLEEFAAINGRPHFSHEILIDVKVVQRIEPVRQEFSGHEEMAQISA